MDLARILSAIVVGIVTGLIVYIIGLVLVELNLDAIGTFVKSIAGLLGLLAAVYYAVTGRRAV